ncbi:hypothetical protein Rhopal_005423-T1 [Rhodotorula paludigena]|uniref:Major facilitator superfamily (MFS) profile domain-containing protein n=1 Tax=Rhodotorula paludigena TaxID=86838 RepID=A0AAV5GUX7_9BASI|nr:hypothetical protein Rhopal_005423-T1 [Rhodotorula paludigena]
MHELERTVSHGVVQHQLPPEEEATFPQLTQAGSHTDAYLETSPSGLVLAREAEAVVGSPQRGSQSTLVSHRHGATDPEKGIKAEDAKLVTWRENDPENPRNFSHSKKLLQVLLPTLLCFTAGLSSSLITGGLPEMAEHYHVSEEVVSLVVCVFVVGFGLGPLILSPLSEMYGRRIVYVVSVGLYFILTLPGCLTDSLAVMIIFRFFAGCCISGVMCNAAGSIGDLYSVNERGNMMATFSAILFASPALGPLMGGYLTIGAGWRWMWWFLFVFGGAVWIFTSILLVETYAPTLLKWRAQKLRKETGDSSIQTEQERQARPIGEIARETLLRPLVMLTTEATMICMSAYLCLVYGLLYAFFFAYPIVFGAHGFNAGEVGLTFLSVLIGIVIVACTACPLQERYYQRQVVKYNGNVPPEARLPLMMGCAILLPISLFIFAATSIKSVHWAVGIYISANTYLSVSYSQHSASAMAAKTAGRSLFGAGLVMYIVPMYKSIGHLWAGMTWAFISLVMVPIPFVFFKYGARIRSRSTMASL